MDTFDLDRTDKAAFDALLVCVSCRAETLRLDGDGFTCTACQARYPVRAGIPVMLRDGKNVYETEPERAEFWDAGWEKRFAAVLERGEAGARAFRDAFLAELREQKYPAVTEITPDTAKGRVLLNIGCGGGQEGLLFAGYGCRYIGIDFSLNAVRFTETLIGHFGGEAACYQGEAERLPLKTESVDIVYTNGVLHHTPNTEEAVREVHRVLVPGGKALIGLYATRSVSFFWYRFRAVLYGCFTAEKIDRWVDANTEGEWQTEGRQNRLTRTYDREGFAAMLRSAGFKQFRIEQSQLQLRDVPVLSRLFSMGPLCRAGAMRLGPFGMMLVAIARK